MKAPLRDFGDEPGSAQQVHGAGIGSMGVAAPQVIGQPLHQATRTPRFRYKVPESLYGSAIFMPMVVRETDFLERLRWHGLSYFWMFVNYVTQILFIVGVFRFAQAERLDDDSEFCEELMPGLLSAALFATTVSVMADIQETYDLWYIVKKLIPTLEETALFTFAETKERPGLHLVGGGFSFRRKTAIVLMILLPKIAMAIALLITSYEFLSVSQSNMDVVLNATGLVFIIEIDELLFSFFSLDEVRTIMAQFPDFDVSESKHHRRRPGFQLLKFAFSIGLVVGGMCYGWSPNRCGSHP